MKKTREKIVVEKYKFYFCLKRFLINEKICSKKELIVLIFGLIYGEEWQICDKN